MHYRKLGRKTLIAAAAATVTLTGAATGVAASTGPGTGAPARHGNLLRSGLIGRPVAADLDVAIRGVPPGGVPWALDRGTARVSATGRIRVVPRSSAHGTPPGGTPRIATSRSAAAGLPMRPARSRLL